MNKLKLLFVFSFLIFSMAAHNAFCYAATKTPAKDITADSAQFSGHLAGKTNVQQALNTLDQLPTTSGALTLATPNQTVTQVPTFQNGIKLSTMSGTDANIEDGITSFDFDGQQLVGYKKVGDVVDMDVLMYLVAFPGEGESGRMLMGPWSVFGETFDITGAVSISGVNGNQSSLEMKSIGTVFSTTIKTTVQSGNAVYTLPTHSQNGFLKNTDGVLSWEQP